MFPLLTIIIAIIVGLSYRGVVQEPHPPDLLGAAAVLLIYGAVAKILYDLAVRRSLVRGEPPSLSLLRVAAPVRVGAVVAYAVIVFQFHWPALTRTLSIEGWILVDELLVLFPIVVLLLLSFLASWTGESRLGVHEFGLGSYIAFQARQYLLPVLPVLFFLTLEDSLRAGAEGGIRWVAELEIQRSAYPFARWISLAALLFVLYCLVPFLIRAIWRARPLPAGPLRERLEDFSRRERFRARDILVWPTGGNILNAAVIGVAGPFRYVLLTDALLEALEDDEVEAVFAHEAGHARHNHVLLYFLFTVGFMLLTSLVIPALNLVSGIGAFLLWFGIIFGFVSRRFEQQADVYGALATGRVRGRGGDAEVAPENHPFIRALEGLSRQMGDIREAKGWRHFSLGDRIAFLTEFLRSSEVRRRYRRGMAALLVCFFGLLGALGVAAAASIPSQIREGRVWASEGRARWLWQQGDQQGAIWEQLRAEEYARQVGYQVADRWEAARDAHSRSQNPSLHPLERLGALIDLYAAYRDLGEFAASRDTLQDVWILVGDHPRVLLLLGDAHRLEGRFRAARLAYEDALGLLPSGAAFVPVLEARLRDLGTVSAE